MANEKRYTARQAAEAVMAKAGELVKKFQALKKYESENSPKLGTQAPHRHQEEVDREDIVGKRRVREQIDPRTNPKENAEGNNAAPGAKPYNTKKYGMEGQIRKSEDKESKDKFGMSVRQHLIDKVHHSMKEHGYKTHEASPNQFKEHAHNIGIKNLNGHEVVHGADSYKHDGADLKKDANDAIQHGINTMTGGQSQSAPPPTAGVASSLASAFGKSEDLKKDFGTNFANAAASGSITPAKIAQGAQSISGAQTSATPPPIKKSDDMGVSKDAPGNSEAKGEGTTLPRSKAQEKWMDKSEMIAGKSTGAAKLAKFLEIRKSQELKKS